MIRFWFEDVRIAMAPGQMIRHHQHGPTDEGWWARSLEFIAGSPVTVEIINDGRDCDGRLQTFTTLELIDGEWVRRDSSQRDYQAEAAGY